MSARRHKLELSMAARPDAVGAVRRELVRWLDDCVPHGERVEAAVGLAASEAVANVVRHAYGDCHGRVDVDAIADADEVQVEVRDAGSGLVAHRTDAEGGMGLPLIGRVADGMTVLSDDEGTTVAMRFNLAPPAAKSRRRAGSRSFFALQTS